jgi:uncharacterized protein YggL (DUF469 family)
MNKRLRKKKHVGEFVEYGYEIVADVNNFQADEPYLKLVDSFFDAGFSIGGGGHHGKLYFFVMHNTDKRRTCSCTEADKETIKKLLGAMMPEYIMSFTISDLLDAWKAPKEEAE